MTALQEEEELANGWLAVVEGGCRISGPRLCKTADGRQRRWLRPTVHTRRLVVVVLNKCRTAVSPPYCCAMQWRVSCLVRRHGAVCGLL